MENREKNKSKKINRIFQDVHHICCHLSKLVLFVSFSFCVIPIEMDELFEYIEKMKPNILTIRQSEEKTERKKNTYKTDRQQYSINSERE